MQCGIFLLLTSFLGCTSCYKDTFAQLHRKKGREFMFICRHIVETIPRLVRGCFQAVSKATRKLGWSKSTGWSLLSVAHCKYSDCTLLGCQSEWPKDKSFLLMHSRHSRNLYDPKIKRIFDTFWDSPIYPLLFTYISTWRELKFIWNWPFFHYEKIMRF